MRLNRSGAAARRPPPGGRQGSRRATRNPRKTRPHSALAQPPGFVTLAGDTEALFSVGFSRPAEPPSYGRLAGRAAAPSDRHPVQFTTGGVATTDARA
jgi:hypothetical protein